MILAGSANGSIYLYDSRSFMCTYKFEMIHAGNIYSLKMMLNNHMIISCSLDCSIKIINLTSKSISHTFKDDSAVYDIEELDDSFIVSCSNKFVKKWNIYTNEVSTIIPGPANRLKLISNNRLICSDMWIFNKLKIVSIDDKTILFQHFFSIFEILDDSTFITIERHSSCANRIVKRKLYDYSVIDEFTIPGGSIRACKLVDNTVLALNYYSGQNECWHIKSQSLIRILNTNTSDFATSFGGQLSNFLISSCEMTFSCWDKKTLEWISTICYNDYDIFTCILVLIE